MFKKIFFTVLITLVFIFTSYSKALASFTFSAVGDYAATTDTNSVLTGISNSGSAFDLAIGDMSYDQLMPESSWCTYVKSYLGNSYPFELLVGNHEEDGHLSYIDNFSSCLPDRIGNIVGTYGKEYYFDYQGLARFIQISPNMTLDGQYYSYNNGTDHNAWLVSAIDSARAVGIKWVIVSMHEYCLNLEDADCPIGTDLPNLLIQKKVDLVLQGHAHQYSRSKQLSFANPNCTKILPGVYNSSCISGNGDKGLYKKDNGTIFLIVGTGGRNLSYIDTNDVEMPYFTTWSGGNINPSFGFDKITISDTSLSTQFIPTGSTSNFTDAFSIIPADSFNNNIDLVAKNSTWKYLDNGSNQGTSWKSLAFDDSSWKNGATQIGYGDGDETTVSGNNIITTYFRKSFNVTDPSQLTSLNLELIRDDGAVVYVNGTEVVRTNMPAGSISYNTLANAYASPPEENYYNSFNIPTGVLVAGTNIITVEVHQATSDSLDMSFNLGLSAMSQIAITPSPSLTPTISLSPTLTPTPSFAPSVTPTPSATPTPAISTLIPANSVWKYLDDGSNQGWAWEALTFNDSTWKNGSAQLGFGDGDETTVIHSKTTNYFRKTFSVSNPSQISSLDLELIRDDGAIVYVNGTEVVRTNMPTGPILYDTYAATPSNSPQENYYNKFIISPSSLVAGTNVVAVEVHQVRSSNDVSFNLSLVATLPAQTTPTPSLTASPSPSATPVISVTPTLSSTPTLTPTVSISPTLSPIPTTTVTVTPTPTVSLSPTPTIAITPTPTPVTATLIPANSAWKYLDTGVNAGTTWKNTSYDDSNWKTGNSELGYGDADEATVTNNNIVTTYFRKSFEVTDTANFLSLNLQIVRDDGAVVYINGNEVLRSNMPTGPIAYDTVSSDFASPPEENYFNSFTISPNALINGTNYIAIEIHQAAIDSIDMSFNLILTATVSGSTITPTSTPSLTASPTLTLTPTPTISVSITPTPTTTNTPTPRPSLTPTPSPIVTLAPISLISKDSSWKYLDTGANLGAAWRSLSFDDSLWNSGLAQLGYGDGDEVTVINSRTTEYFRKTFNVTDTGKIGSLNLQLIRDDGAVVYINGTEVVRTNMPSGDIFYNTLASAFANSPEENYYTSFEVPTGVLVNGTNIVSVEVHQGSGSVDVSFNLGLTAN